MGYRQTADRRPVLGTDYIVHEGRRFPIVRGGDGPTEGDDFSQLIRLVEQAEGDLGELTAEFSDEGALSGGELHDLLSGLQGGYREARAAVETDEQVEALRQVVAATQRVAAEASRRVTEAAQAAADAEQQATERQEALAALDADVEATLASDGESDDDGAGDGAGADDNDGESEDADDADGDEDDADAEAARRQASARPGRRPSMAALRGLQRPAGASPAGAGAGAGGAEGAGGDPQRGALAGRIVASSSLPDFGTGHVFADTEELGRTLARLAGDLQVDTPTLRKHVVGRVKMHDGGHAVAAKDFAGSDADVIAEATLAARRARLERAQAMLTGDRPTRRVASGGICAPAQPDYSIMVVGDRGTPFVDSLPTVVAERPLSYFPWLEVSMNDAAGSRPGARPDGGIGTVTAAQDAAGYGGTNMAGVTTAIPDGGHAYKDCVRIDCPEPVESAPEATFKCVTIGQFQALTFREYVAAFEETTGIYFDVYRDERSISKVLAAAKVVQATPETFGAARDVLTKLRRLRDFIRSDRHAAGMQLDVRVPEFALTMIANDLAVSYANGAENLRITQSEVLALLAAEEGIMVDTYSVSAGTTTGGSPTLLPQQAAGALNDWPEEVRLLVWAEGSVFRTSYGELSFGLRETGMETNDYSTFEETFEQTSIRGSDVFALDLRVCENGAQGAAVAVTCTDPQP